MNHRSSYSEKASTSIFQACKPDFLRHFIRGGTRQKKVYETGDFICDTNIFEMFEIT